MCGIAGALSLSGQPLAGLDARLGVMNDLLRHRGPDGQGQWTHPAGHLGLTHRRLSIIDLETGQQPMGGPDGSWIVQNGEIYNFIELRDEIGRDQFVTASDTEVILRAYRRWGRDCLSRLRGMFAFALWDDEEQTLLCARDRFGIKPFYYAVVGEVLYFASEAKALMPFLDRIETDDEGLKDYLAFQFCLAGKTLFRGVSELLPGHCLVVRNGRVESRRYWEIYYDLDFDHTGRYFEERLRELLEESVDLHLRSDVPVGAYLSGGLDSSTVLSVARQRHEQPTCAFTGRFPGHPEFDESRYARLVAEASGVELLEAEIGPDDFTSHLHQILYHLDFPVAGPGSFPQFMVSRLASQHRKVVLGGQGGDEIFGGYARYLIAYFEQCIKAAIDDTMHDGKFIVTYESIIPNLTVLRQYKPLLQEFWREGLFEDMDRRYFRLVNRSASLGDEIRWDRLSDYSPWSTFRDIFRGSNVGEESYFDLMTHFDFKTLLPALLHVEDRVSMAHGLEARVPFLDHPLVELAATAPSDVKFKDGTLKRLLKRIAEPLLPEAVSRRKDKMGFPVPLTQWLHGPVRDYVRDTLSSRAAMERDLIDNAKVLAGLEEETTFGRKVWGLLCLEVWQQNFHDRGAHFRGLVDQPAAEAGQAQALTT